MKRLHKKHQLFSTVLNILPMMTHNNSKKEKNVLSANIRPRCDSLLREEEELLLMVFGKDFVIVDMKC